MSASPPAEPSGPHHRQHRPEPPDEQTAEQTQVGGAPLGPDEVELMPIGRRSGMALPPRPDSPPDRPAAPVAAAQPAAPEPASGPIGSGRSGGRHASADDGEHSLPYAQGGDAGAPPPPPPPAPPMGQPAGDPDEPEDLQVEIVDAEIVDEAPRPYAAADVQTDEWTTVPQAPGVSGPPPGPYPQAPMGQPPLRRAPHEPRPPSQPGSPSQPGLLTPGPRHAGPPAGPGIMAADTWDTAPLPPVDGEYEGRRRRGARALGSRPTRAGWLVVLGVVLSLSAAVAVPFIIAAPGAEDRQAAPTDRPTTTRTSPGTVPIGGPTLPYVMAPTATPSPSPTPSPATSTSPAPGQSPSSSAAPPQPSQSPPTSNNPPQLYSATLQAESGSLSGCALTRSVAGATVVDRLGDDWNGWGSPSWDCDLDQRGVVTFTVGSLPSGTYSITVHYVFAWLSDYDSRRDARLRLDRSGGSSGDRNLEREYSRGSCSNNNTNCPLREHTFTGVQLTSGNYTVTFTNPDSWGQYNRAPALDKIVIQQTS